MYIAVIYIAFYIGLLEQILNKHKILINRWSTSDNKEIEAV